MSIQLAVVISGIYWSLLLFKPDLILRAPEAGEWEPSSSSKAPDLIRIPLKLDIALHAAPGTTLLLDFFIFEQKYTKDYAQQGGAIVAALAGLWYSCWVEYCASVNGICKFNHCSVDSTTKLRSTSPIPIPDFQLIPYSCEYLCWRRDLCIPLLPGPELDAYMSLSSQCFLTPWCRCVYVRSL